ncbi:PEP-CTERM sorting domain-containing protein [Roseibacillus ishigakijimensis]|nr:PEP-CTERM sorting domain-containing protein [Roseibacillus ishigakijimensis]
MKFRKYIEIGCLNGVLCSLVASSGAAVTLVDFQQLEAGETLAPQAGAIIQLAADGGAPSYSFSAGSLDFTLTAGGAGGIIVGRNATDGRTNVLPDLSMPDFYADMWVGRNGDGTVLVSVEGLMAGEEVSFLFGHNESYTVNQGFNAGQTITPTLLGGGVLGFAMAGTVTGINGSSTATDADLMSSEISFVSDGGTATILLTSTGSAFVPLNGIQFESVPEPGVLGLLIFSAAGFVRRKR